MQSIPNCGSFRFGVKAKKLHIRYHTLLSQTTLGSIISQKVSIIMDSRCPGLCNIDVIDTVFITIMIEV